MLKKTKFLFVFVVSVVLSITVLKSFDANSIISSTQFDLSSIDLRTPSNKTNKTIDDFRSKIQRPKYDVNCRQIFEMNKTEINIAKKTLLLQSLQNENNEIALLDDENFIFPKEMCPLYKEIRFGEKIENDELEMSLAYSILVYNNVEQFERLLNVLYSPNNVYCIHIDVKSEDAVKLAIKSIVDCFDNVFIATQLEHVVYEGFSRLKADLNCLSDLLELDLLIVSQHENLKNKRAVEWKYFLNMASSEFPLRTNYELTRILTAYNGSNEIEIVKYIDPNRIKFSFIEDTEKNRVVVTSELKTDPPHNFTIAKGYAFCVISRNFAEYAIWDANVKDLIEWGKDTFSPDEWFWATLQYNTDKYPTGFKDDENVEKFDTMVRFAGWANEYQCKGLWRHSICVFSIDDLPEMLTRNHFVVNKFLLEYDPIAYQCMEEWFYERQLSSQPMNMFFYCNWIKNHSYFANC